VSSYCGVDFGTSNSVIVLSSDESGEPMVIREPSLMYFAEDPDSTATRFCGSEALDRYVEAGMTGRFFQSIKTVLPDPLFTQTVINGKRFTPEDLVAVMLRYLRSRIEEASGAEVRRAVIGRPARFSSDPEGEALAESRLLAATRQAGFDDVIFEFEPVAGAQSYLHRATGEPLVFVADHGGGTSDFTVMKIRAGDEGNAGGSAIAGRVGTAAGEVLATWGIRAGGDDFDAEIMWNRVVELFGYGTSYESFGQYLPVPVHIFRMISRWDQIHFLKTTKYREELRSYLRSSDNPLPIRRLIKLVEENLGLFVARAVEAAKIELSTAATGVVRYEKDRLRIAEEVSRSQFDEYLSHWIESIAEAVDHTLQLAGVLPGDIDAVFMTGGSSLVPAVRDIFEQRFGRPSIVGDSRRFQSVAEGLALLARLRGLAIV
jgi:hypothetical chaperone protein